MSADVLGTARGALAARSDHAPAVLRIGVGLMLLLAGGHKLVAPEVWSAYTPP